MNKAEIGEQVRKYLKRLMMKDREHLMRYGYVCRGIRDEVLFTRGEIRFWEHA